MSSMSLSSTATCAVQPEMAAAAQTAGLQPIRVMGEVPEMRHLQALRASLSAARVATYETATVGAGLPVERAVELYAWNAQVSGVFLIPLHICEVVVRNAVSEALTLRYGTEWPWSVGLLRSLPTCAGPRYDARTDLSRTREKHRTTGGVVAELKNVFWEKQFTKRNDQRLWEPYLFQLFPNLNPSGSVKLHRRRIACDLETVRHLRNRIAHHEPIFNRNLHGDFQKICELVELRCSDTASMMLQAHRVMEALKARPF